jgi:hypothetical protein
MSRVTVKTVSIIIHERIEKTRCTEHFFPVPNCARQRNKKDVSSVAEPKQLKRLITALLTVP